MNKKSFFLSLLCVILFNSVFAQRNEVSVNPLTGAASVAIPIYSVSSGQVSAPISLVYSAGAKVRDVEGSAGMGWQVAAGGQISRQVRGLPDDCTFDNASTIMEGWMDASNTTINYADTVVFHNNNNLTCANETTDVNHINTYINSSTYYAMDTEPDIFYVDAPGLSCQLVYDRVTAKFHPVSYQDLIISYTVYGGSGNNANNIATFTITNNKGIKYQFNLPEIVSQKTVLGGGSATYFATKYNQYKNGVTYADSWVLTSITDPAGNGVQFNYIAAPGRNSTDPVILYMGGTTLATAIQYDVQQAVTPLILSSINTFNKNNSTTCFTFTWNTLSGTSQSGETVVTSITGMGSNFTFTYSNEACASGFSRAFLKEFSDPVCNTPIDYKFSYVGETYNSGYGTYSTALPDSSSALTDYWGYYCTNASAGSLIPTVYILNPTVSYYPRYLIAASGSPGTLYQYATLSGNTRSVAPASIATGSLNKVTYVATGGNTNIIYEPNDYYDVPSGSVVQGGGIRVKQIVDSVGNGSTNTMIRNYSYLNPTSGVSSGKPISLPQFAFTVPYSGSATGATLWEDATALSAYDLSTEDHTIMYAYAKVSQTGAGSTQYSYSIPATYWDAEATPSCSGCNTVEWFPTVNMTGRYSCSLTYGPIQNYTYSYPFIPNPNYDFERGLPIKVTSYNDAGSEVSETNYTYQRSYTPSVLTAFKSDDNDASGLMAKSYNRYLVYYNVSELTATVNQKIFDSSSSGNAQSSTVTYTYGSPYHKLLTQQQTTNSDNSTLTSHITYSKDLTAATSGSGNQNITAIYNLQQQNINIPIESYQQVTRGGTTTTSNASLTLFRDTTLGSATVVIPAQKWQWIQPTGAAFTPLSISGSILTKDANYFDVGNFDIFDNTGYPLTVDDNNKNLQTTLFDHNSNQVTAVFKNAAYNQVAFSDFDTDESAISASKFTITGSGSYTPVGSHAGNAAGLFAVTQTATSGTLSKNTVTQNYIFSIWINASAAGTLTLTLSGISPNSTISYSGGWKYYELKIPAASLASSFTVSFTASTSISMDDILFYPDAATVTTAAYDAVGHYKIAQTNTNGVSAYFTNDQWGRMLYAFDQDNNIVQKNTYVTPANIQNFPTPTITYSGGTNTNVTPVTFYGTYYNACQAADLIYSWTFGDGTSYQSTANVAPPHTYTTPGTYTVNLSISSPYYGTKTAAPVNITIIQATASVTLTNYTTGGGVTGITITNSSHSYSGSGITIVPGTYTISFTPVGQPYNPGTGKGMTNVVFSDGGNGYCFSWGTGGSHTFTWTVNAGDTLNFSIYNNNYCPFD